MNKRKTSTENRTPFSREEIVREVRLAALGLASHIANFGLRQGQLDSASRYLGVELDDYEYHHDGHHQLDQIPIEDHFLYTVVMDAYDHAYQVGRAVLEGFDFDETAHEVSAIYHGFPQTDFNGEPTPLDRNNPQKLRQVLETFLARYVLDTGGDLTVTELALLANMGEPAVRSSLSAEGIKSVAGQKGEKNQVRHSDALAWLSGRRGFVPTTNISQADDSQVDIISGIFSAESLTFESALQRAIAASPQSTASLAEQAQVDIQVIENLLAPGVEIDADISALRRLALALNAPVPLFVGRAVTAILERREDFED